MAINASRAGAITLILLSAFFFFIAGEYPSEVALFPRALLIGIMVLSAALFVRSYQFEAYKANLVMGRKMQVCACALMAVVYVASMRFVGYYAASAAFIILLSLFLRFQSKVVTIVVAVGYPLIVYTVFEVLLNIPVPSIGY